MKSLKIFVALFCAIAIANCASMKGSSLSEGQARENSSVNDQGFDPESVENSGPIPSANHSQEGSVMAPMPGENSFFRETESQGHVEPTHAKAVKNALELPPGTSPGVRIVEFKFEYIVDKFWGSFVPESSSGVIPTVKRKNPAKTIKFKLKPTPKDKPYYVNFGYDIDTWAVDLDRNLVGKVFVRVNQGPWVEFTAANTESGDGVHWNFRLDVP